MCCSVLRCVEMSCSVLQKEGVLVADCSAPLYSATLQKRCHSVGLPMQCSVLQYGAVCCRLLQSFVLQVSGRSCSHNPLLPATIFSVCSVLQCVAVCCSVLQCVAVCYKEKVFSYCVLVVDCFTDSWHKHMCCTVFQCVAVCCSVLQREGVLVLCSRS